MIKNVKNTVPWTYVISDLNGLKIIGTFYEKELKNANQKEFRTEKVIKKVINCILNRRVVIIHLILGLMKSMLYKNESIFS